MNLNILVEKIRSIGYFPNSTIEYIKETDKTLPTIRIVTGKSFCASFSITFHEYSNTVEIYINRIKRCLYSGSNILEGIEMIARNSIGLVGKIELEDASTVDWGDILVDFGLINILSKGRSWYNSLGYYQNDFDSEFDEWKGVRNMKFYECLEYIQSAELKFKDYDSKLSDYYDSGFELYAINVLEIPVRGDTFEEILEKLFDYIINSFDEMFPNIDIRSILVGELFSNIYFKIKSGNLDDSLYYYSIVGLFSLFVTYSRKSLIKII